MRNKLTLYAAYKALKSIGNENSRRGLAVFLAGISGKAFGFAVVVVVVYTIVAAAVQAAMHGRVPPIIAFAIAGAALLVSLRFILKSLDLSALKSRFCLFEDEVIPN